MSTQVAGYCDEIKCDVPESETKDWAGTCYAWSPRMPEALHVSFRQDIRCEHCKHFHKREVKQ